MSPDTANTANGDPSQAHLEPMTGVSTPSSRPSVRIHPRTSRNGNKHEPKDPNRYRRYTTIDLIREARQERELPPLGPIIMHHTIDWIKRRFVLETWKPAAEKLRIWSMIVPLMAAVLAPISTLYDIPGLSEHWYCYQNTYPAQGGCQSPSDHIQSLWLSAWGLFLNVIGNTLLILRFCDFPWWHLCAHLSNVFWLLKTIIALVNVSVYGAALPTDPPSSFNEGFYCAMISVILSGTISLILVRRFSDPMLWILLDQSQTYHTIIEFTLPGPLTNDTEEFNLVRATGRQFMLSVTAMVALLALEALIFSRIEDWTFLQGLYYAVVTGFTIGFGDFSPSNTSTRILLFFFAVASITYLANQVSMIVNFIQSRAQARQMRWRAEFERKQQLMEDERKPNLDLATEMAFLEQLSHREAFMTQLHDLIWSGVYLVGLLLIGAAAFSRIEHWNYGTALYFTYVSVLTIGYGDVVPITPAGRSFFIIFAFVAVPIVTSFAVQSVTGLVGVFANSGLKSKERSLEEEKHKEAFTQHHEWVSQHTTFLESRVKVAVDTFGAESLESLKEDIKFQREMHRRFAVATLSLGLKLEMQARRLLIGQLKQHSREQTLLRADLHVQTKIRSELWKDHRAEEEYSGGVPLTRDGGEDANLQRLRNEHNIFGHEITEPELPTDLDTLEEIGEYRRTFAQFLAVGSRLLHLDGFERYYFERRLAGMTGDATAADMARRVTSIEEEMEQAERNGNGHLET